MRDSPRGYVSPAGSAPYLTPTIQIHEVAPVWKIRAQALSRRDVGPRKDDCIDLPARPNSGLGNDPYLLWKAPGDWLAYSTKHSVDPLTQWLRDLRYPDPLILTDVSAGMAVIEMRGPGVIELLLRDCSLDLEGTALMPGACAQTSFAHAHILLHRPLEEPNWRLFVERSVALHVWEWLVDTAESLEASA